MRLRWTEPAVHDLTQICDYIEQHGSPGSGRRVALSIYESVAGLTSFLERGRMGRKPGTRELDLVRMPYLAIYRIRKEAVEILRILHGAQSWP